MSGELVWPSGIEFQVAGNWSGVPDPVRSTERRAAYVFAASGSPTDTFYLPDPKSATTMEMAGAHGYTLLVRRLSGERDALRAGRHRGPAVDPGSLHGLRHGRGARRAHPAEDA